jgi:hypothetical protein
MTASQRAAVARFRWWLGLFWIGLVLSGVTAFPLLTELRVLVDFLGLDRADRSVFGAAEGIVTWVLRVRAGLEDVYVRYPWLAYGTDWLAFGHLAISLFFIGPWIRPAGSRGVLLAGMAACVAVIPTALICGQIRGIPLGWRMIDCSFGVFGIVPLIACYRLLSIIESTGSGGPPAEDAGGKTNKRRQ